MKIHQVTRISVSAMAVVAGATVLAAPALASAESHRSPAQNVSFDLPAGYCTFPVHVGVVNDKEYFVQQNIASDGTQTFRVTGQLVLRLTNADTGKSVVANVSGPGTITFSPDGHERADVQGRGFAIANEAEQVRAQVPGLILTTGHAIGLYDSAGLASLTVSGQLTDGCALLS